jgi:hypothetical protein
MANVTRNAQPKSTITFIGKAWVNTVKKADSKFVGTEFINVVLDNGIDNIVLQQGDRIQLWPNDKREGDAGKNDADYRVSVVDAPIAA